MAIPLLPLAQTLNSSMETLAALGALLRVRREGLAPDPRVAAALGKVIGVIDPGLLETSTPQEEVIAVGYIRAFFLQALELLEDPTRAPGWTYTEPAILQAYGVASRQVVRAIEALAAEDEWIRALLLGDGRLLDIGTGVGGLALAAASTWPRLRVLGIDIFEPALALAREAVSRSGLGDRIELRRQGVQDLDPAERFHVAWFPGPFIPSELVAPALGLLRRALVPGGALVFGFFGAPTPLAAALNELRAARCGGQDWSTPAAQQALTAAGFELHRVFAEGSLATLVIGRNPGN